MISAEAYLSVLNPEQREAVEHEGSPLLILAGAGSGKTRVITTKIAWLIGVRNDAPESLLAVTFTKKAAAEMSERANHLDERASRAQIRTFHSFGSWFLRTNGRFAGLDSNFTVYDDDDSASLLSKAVPELSRMEVSSAVHKIARAKDYCLEPDSPSLDTIDPDPEFREIYAKYQKRLRETGNVDFGDLIQLPVKVLSENEEIRQRMHQRFGVVMVDEYQDSNVAQFELLKALTGRQTYVCVVGDDDQSIYRFRGAEVRNILTFQDHFPGTQIIRLERNYRSVAPVLSVAGQVVSCNEGRLGKTLRAERAGGKRPALVFLANQDEEAAFCAELVEDAVSKGCPYSDWAVLYRTNAQSLGFETEFLRRKIPYRVIGSLKFYEREEIKDALAFLSLTANPRDEIAFRRIVNKPARGIGTVSQEKIVDEARRGLYDGTGTGNLIEAARAVLPSMSKKARSGLSEFAEIMTALGRQLDGAESAADDDLRDLFAGNSGPGVRRGGKLEGLAAFVDKLVTLSGLMEYHTAQDEIAGTQRAANLQELVNGAVQYPFSRDGLIQFLDHIELDRSIEEDDGSSGDSVSLITIHNTKGLEFPRVIITGLESGIFPREDKTGDDLEEERRLFYVGITRAKDELYLTSCASRRLYGRTAFVEPSPFLLEIHSDSVDILGRRPPGFGRRDTTRGTDASGSWDPMQERWGVGQRLFHDEYGYGIITKASYSDDEYVITVQFETGSVKRFMPKYQANSLLRIGNDE